MLFYWRGGVSLLCCQWLTMKRTKLSALQQLYCVTAFRRCSTPTRPHRPPDRGPSSEQGGRGGALSPDLIHYTQASRCNQPHRWCDIRGGCESQPTAGRLLSRGIAHW